MLERFYVHNYRCFENFEIDFRETPSLLIIGKNGSGKSTLRHALGVLQKLCSTSTRIRNLVVEDDFAQNRKDIPIRFEAEVKLDGKQFIYQVAFELPERFHELRILEECLKVDMKREAIGRLLAENCSNRTTQNWSHEHLAHNLPEVERLTDAVRSFLFPA